MSVGVGSLQDPMKAQGLAHYLEHMLFMGRNTLNKTTTPMFLSFQSSSSQKILACLIPTLPSNKLIFTLKWSAMPLRMP